MSGTNIIHKAMARIANLAQMIGGFKEANRKRLFVSPVANDTYVNAWVAPWDGLVESLWISSPAGATTSTSSNHVAVTVQDVTSAAVLTTFDTYANLTELLANQGTEFDVSLPALSAGAAYVQFKKGDVLAIKGTVTGTPGIANTDKLDIVLAVCPTDPKFAF